MIRKACKADFQAISTIVAIEQKTNPIPWSEKMLLSHFDNEEVFVLRMLNSDEIIGFLIGQCVADEATLMHLVIDISHQSKGYARLLLNEWLDSLPDTICNIWLEVRESNMIAQKLYESCGFNQVSTRKNYYRTNNTNIRETALVYRLSQ